MTEYYTSRKQGKIFVHSVWVGSYFIAVKFNDNKRILPFSPYMEKRFKSYEEAASALNDYAEAHQLQEVEL